MAEKGTIDNPYDSLREAFAAASSDGPGKTIFCYGDFSRLVLYDDDLELTICPAAEQEGEQDEGESNGAQ